jgi:hypothetical protein
MTFYPLSVHNQASRPIGNIYAYDEELQTNDSFRSLLYSVGYSFGSMALVSPFEAVLTLRQCQYRPRRLAFSHHQIVSHDSINVRQCEVYQGERNIDLYQGTVSDDIHSALDEEDEENKLEDEELSPLDRQLLTAEKYLHHSKPSNSKSLEIPKIITNVDAVGYIQSHKLTLSPKSSTTYGDTMVLLSRNPLGSLQGLGLFASLKRVIASQGLLSIWKGLFTSLIYTQSKGFFQRSLYGVVEGYLLLHYSSTLLSDITCDAVSFYISYLFSGLLFIPFEVVRTR